MSAGLMNYNQSLPGLIFPSSETVSGDKSFCQLEAANANKDGTLALTSRCGIDVANGDDPSKCNQMYDYEKYEYAILNQNKQSTPSPSPVIDDPNANLDYFNLRCSPQVSNVTY